MRILSGQNTVATGGTAEAFASSVTRVAWIRVKPLETNTGEVYIGNDGDNDVSSSTGYELAAAAAQEDRALTLTAPLGGTINLADLYLDVENNGEGVNWIALQDIGG